MYKIEKIIIRNTNIEIKSETELEELRQELKERLGALGVDFRYVEETIKLN